MTWFRVAVGDSIPPGSGKPLDLGGRRVALFNDGGTYFAIDDQCPHRGGSLGEGILTAGEVACPWHGWTFDLRTGHNRLDSDERVACFPVRRAGDDLEVGLPDVETVTR